MTSRSSTERLGDVVRAGVLSHAPGSESVTRFTCLTFHRLVRSVGLLLVFGVVLFGLMLLSCCSLTNLCDRVING